MKVKRNRLNIRISDIVERRLLAICEVTGKTKTKVIEDLIASEYNKKREYNDQYYKILDRQYS